VLLAEQRYFWYGLAPLLYNAGIIAGTVLFGLWPAVAQFLLGIPLLAR